MLTPVCQRHSTREGLVYSSSSNLPIETLIAAEPDPATGCNFGSLYLLSRQTSSGKRELDDRSLRSEGKPERQLSLTRRLRSEPDRECNGDIMPATGLGSNCSIVWT